MSGDIFKSPENFEDFDSSRWNPLHCYICKEQYTDPSILPCYHSYCSRCLLNRVSNGNISCPLCGKDEVVKENTDQLDPDPLLQFLVESSSADRTQCANCDTADSQMYFCNTCAQPLCVTCKEETHQARMFSSHEIVVLSKRTKDVQRDCKLHNEPFILFSTEKKQLLCINCFRDMKIESRSHCVDLETAYKQGCNKLDDTMQSIRDLQHSVRDAILLLRALLEEVEKNAESEEDDISVLFDTMQEKISETKLLLLEEVKKQYKEKEMLFKNQLVNLSTFLPTLHVHLVTCAAFSSTANKYEFLDFTYVLMQRLKSILQVQHPLHPSQGSDIITDYKAQFAKCLEPLLFPHRNGAGNNVPSSMANSTAIPRLEISPAVIATVANVMRTTTVVNSQGAAGNRRMSNNQKFKMLDTKGFFADHCKEFDDAHREMMQNVEKLKLQTQELQRDLTLRRCLARNTSVDDLKSIITEMEVGLEIHHQTVEQKQPSLEKHWEESLERLASEQEVYKAQIQDVMRLKQETQSVKTILTRLSSFVSSIANVTERIAPELSRNCNNIEQDCQHQALLLEIITVQPDSQQRVDAIRTAQEERETKTANRMNPLDEELIKTKGLLKAPSARKDSSKRDSRELKDMVALIEEHDGYFDVEPSKTEKKPKMRESLSPKSGGSTETFKIKSGSNDKSKVKLGSGSPSGNIADENGKGNKSGQAISEGIKPMESQIDVTGSNEDSANSKQNSDIVVSSQGKDSLEICNGELKSQSRGVSPGACGDGAASEQYVPVDAESQTHGQSKSDSVSVTMAAFSELDINKNVTEATSSNVEDGDDLEERNGYGKTDSSTSPTLTADRSRYTSESESSRSSLDEVVTKAGIDDLSAEFTIMVGDCKNGTTSSKVNSEAEDGGKCKSESPTTENGKNSSQQEPVSNGNIRVADGMDDEEYVPKTLPELTQVFEPTEKPVRRKRRSKSESVPQIV